MTRIVGVALAGLFVAACGHATPTGSAQNGWATPTGYASATHPRYINPDAAAGPARDRSAFEAQAPPQQPGASDVTSAPPPAMLPPADEQPIMPPDTSPRDGDEVPPYVVPVRP
jgi:hypothetical protein